MDEIIKILAVVFWIYLGISVLKNFKQWRKEDE